MLEGLNKWLGRKEAEKMAAMKPDEEDQAQTDSTDLVTWMKGAKAKGFEGETGESNFEVTAGELHAKFDAATAKQIAEKKLNHPHLELVESKPSKPAAIVKETKNPFTETKEDASEVERRLLVRLNNAEAEIAAIRAELEVLKAKKRIEVA